MSILLALALACSATANDTAVQSPLVLRSYDLSAIQPSLPAQRMAARLLPRLLSGSGAAERGSERTSQADELVAEIEHLYGAELQQEGRSIQLWDGARLVVRAPEAVHQGVAQLLEFWENAFASSTELTIDCVRLDAPGLAATPGLVTLADADRMLGALPPAAQRRTYRIVVAPGETGALELVATKRLVVDLDCEIAQEAGLLDPKVENVETGVRIEAACAPAPGGVWLALVQRELALLGVRETELRTHVQISADSSFEERSLARELQGADVLNSSLGFNAFLPEGKALVVQTSLGVETGRTSALLVVRAAGPTPPREYHLALNGLGRRGEIDVYAWGFSAPPSVTAKGRYGALDEFSLAAWSNESAEERALFVQFDHASADPLFGFLQDDPAEFHHLWGPFLVAGADSEPASDGAKRREIHALVASRLAPAPRLLQVTLTLKRARGSGEALARAVLPVRLGEQGFVVLGTESHRLWDYDVEVAQKASIADPLVCDSFDGFVGAVRPRLAAGGGIAVELYGEARVQHGPAREFDARATTIGALWQADFDQVSLRERVVFPKDARKPVVLGDAGGNGPGGLQLEVEVAELR